MEIETLDLKSLLVFTRVGELGSLSKAAASLGLTQPTMSRIIGALETQFGGALFYRTGRGVSLTELGSFALPRAKALLTEADQLSADVRDLGRAPSGLVSLAILPSMMQPLVARLYLEMATHNPGIRLRILEGFSGQIEAWIAEGRTDIGLLTRYRTSSASRDDVLMVSELYLIAPPNAATMEPTVDFKKLAGLPLVLPASPNGLRVLLEETARQHLVSLNVVLEADSLTAQKDMVRRCACYTVLTRQAIYEELAGGKLAASRIVRPTLSRQAVITTSTQRPLSRAGRTVLHTVRRLVSALIDEKTW